MHEDTRLLRFLEAGIGRHLRLWKGLFPAVMSMSPAVLFDTEKHEPGFSISNRTAGDLLITAGDLINTSKVAISL